ncbi:2-C-methyl-D-erythritol 2,4-cyclodiphosphate synthase [Bacillota bacterium LX-D]|nr:2-C-methyl-D-erythritol 2,4-cyclodiphosphate synthase [Bacillota bacterium LX-D]
MRVGIGYDVHTLEPKRKLVLGGVEIPYELGLAGHSDADVLLHAIMDALLGAAALGDIGRHFPDTDQGYKDISSMVLLLETKEKITAAGFKVNNIDAVVVAQKPHLAAYIPQMQKNIALTLEIKEQQVNVKATTTENLGFTGRGEGIAAQAVCMLDELNN